MTEIKSQKENLRGVCRACLSTNQNMKRLSEEETEGKLLIKLYTSLNNFEWLNDETSSYLCSSCELALESSYEFQQRCRHNHEIIKNVMNSNKTPENNNRVVIIKRRKVVQREEEVEVQEVTPAKIEEVVPPKKYLPVEVLKAIDNFVNEGKNHKQCIVCSEETPPKFLNTHMYSEHLDIFRRWCPICNKVFTDLAHHFNNVHKDALQYCGFCKSQIRRANFLSHLYSHAHGYPLKCEHCSITFAEENHLKEHKQTSHPQKDENEETGNYNEHDYCQTKEAPPAEPTPAAEDEELSDRIQCKYCSKSFLHPKRYAKHVKLHTSPLICRYCDKPFRQKARLVQHEMVHTGQKSFLCPICHKGFISRYACKMHLKRHQNGLPLRPTTRDKPFACKKCSRRFFRSSDLMEHMKVHGDVIANCIDAAISIVSSE